MLNYIPGHPYAEKDKVADFLVIERVEDPISENLQINEFAILEMHSPKKWFTHYFAPSQSKTNPEISL